MLRCEIVISLMFVLQIQELYKAEYRIFDLLHIEIIACHYRNISKY